MFGLRTDPSTGVPRVAGEAPLNACIQSTEKLRGAAVLVAILALLSGSAPAAAAQPLEPSIPLQGNAVSGLNSARRIADEDGANGISVQLALKLRDRGQLDDLIRRVSTPGSPEYGHYLTPAQFGARFGPTAEQVGQAVGFLQANGLQVTGASFGSTLVDARGSVGAVTRALHTQIGHYRESSGRDFFANDTAPSLPSSLASLVVGVHGLDNRHPLHHAAIQARTCCASPPYTPAQVKTAYGLTTAPLAGLTGSGRTMGLMELDDFSQTNLNGYSTAYSLATVTPTRQVVDLGVNPHSNNGQIEVELDIELMHAIAPAAAIMVFEGPNSVQGLNDTYSCMVNPNAATAAGACPNKGSGTTASTNSTSWGLCEPFTGLSEAQTLDVFFARAAAQGQSFFAASGDFGGFDCFDPSNPTGAFHNTPAVDSPAGDPYVTAAGGTKLQLNNDNTYNNEVAWPGEPASYYGSGGGLSTFFARPPWQVGAGVINGSSNGMREVPDIALDADPVTGYSIFTCLNLSGTCDPTAVPATAGLRGLGGTSAAAPAWAGFTALYNQYAASLAKPAMGFANPVLYSAKACPQTFQPYNDITAGDNFVYPTTAGYDMVTGWGSPRASELAQSIAGLGSAALKINSVDQAVGVEGGTIHLIGCGFKTSGPQVPAVTFGAAVSGNVIVVNSTDLAVVVPAHPNGLVSITVTNPAGAGGASFTLPAAFTYNQPPPPPPPAGGTNLYGALLNGSGSGMVEVHALSQNTHYTQFTVHAASAFGASSAADWQFFVSSFQGDGQPDLFGIHMRNTGSGRVEVHVLSATSGYQTFTLHAATPLPAVPPGIFEFSLGSSGGDHSSNLYAIALNSTGSGTVEVHALSEASNYTTWALHSTSALGSPLSTADWQFRVGDRFGSGDLVGIFHASTGSGRTEVHVASWSSGYQTFSVHTATPLGLTTDSQIAYGLGDHDNDGVPDVYVVVMNGTGSGQAEIHVLSGAANFATWIEHTASGLGPVSPNSWQFSTR